MRKVTPLEPEVGPASWGREKSNSGKVVRTCLKCKNSLLASNITTAHAAATPDALEHHTVVSTSVSPAYDKNSCFPCLLVHDSCFVCSPRETSILQRNTEPTDVLARDKITHGLLTSQRGCLEPSHTARCDGGSSSRGEQTNTSREPGDKGHT